VLRNIPSITELRHLDVSGKEQVRVSRVQPDVVGSQEDWSQSPPFLAARTGKLYWSPVVMQSEAEPSVTLAMPVGKYAVEVTMAEISLRAVLRVIDQAKVGPGGYVYVVDAHDQLIAHPDSRIRRERRNLSGLAQVKAARAEGASLTGSRSRPGTSCKRSATSSTARRRSSRPPAPPSSTRWRSGRASWPPRTWS
jgi:hypothetical protein